MKGKKSEGKRRYHFKLENEKQQLAVGCSARKRELPGARPVGRGWACFFQEVKGQCGWRRGMGKEGGSSSGLGFLGTSRASV